MKNLANNFFYGNELLSCFIVTILEVIYCSATAYMFTGLDAFKLVSSFFKLTDWTYRVNQELP